MENQVVQFVVISFVYIGDMEGVSKSFFLSPRASDSTRMAMAFSNNLGFPIISHSEKKIVDCWLVGIWGDNICVSRNVGIKMANLAQKT